MQFIVDSSEFKQTLYRNLFIISLFLNLFTFYLQWDRMAKSSGPKKSWKKKKKGDGKGGEREWICIVHQLSQALYTHCLMFILTMILQERGCWFTADEKTELWEIERLVQTLTPTPRKKSKRTEIQFFCPVTGFSIVPRLWKPDQVRDAKASY